MHSRLGTQNCCLPPAEPRRDMGDQQCVGPSLPSSRSPHHPPLTPMGESQTAEDSAKGVKIQWRETQWGTSGRAAGAKVNVSWKIILLN